MRNRWKSRLNHQLYRRPRLNRRLICIKRSLEELCMILNDGCRCRRP